MNKSDLAKKIAEHYPEFTMQQLNDMVSEIFDEIVRTLFERGRIEIRDFGSWFLKARKAGKAHNPRTGKILETNERYALRFKAGKELKELVDG